MSYADTADWRRLGGLGPAAGKLVGDAVLRQFVQARLDKRWSPQQVCAALRREFLDEPARQGRVAGSGVTRRVLLCE